MPTRLAVLALSAVLAAACQRTSTTHDAMGTGSDPSGRARRTGGPERRSLPGGEQLKYLSEGDLTQFVGGARSESPSAAVLKAWKDAGFELDSPASTVFSLPPQARQQLERLPDLPDPKVPFGIYLGQTRISDAGLKGIKRLTSLTSLHLNDTPVTDAGLKELAVLTNLNYLKLSGTQITDAGLKELKGLRNLKYLNLVGTQVTDAGIKELSGLEALGGLALFDTKVSDKGVNDLRKSLPNCTIEMR